MKLAKSHPTTVSLLGPLPSLNPPERMPESTTADHPRRPVGGDADRLATLQHAIDHAAHLLPTQGPITVFVHHNTLHALEDVSFEQAVLDGARTFGCETYLPEARYRQELDRGRIRVTDLSAELLDDLGDRGDVRIAGLCSRFDLRLAMLRYPLRQASSVELKWLVAETDALRSFRQEAPPSLRAKMVDETRRWVMRDLRNGHATEDAAAERLQETLDGLFDLFGKSNIENWSESAWESFTLHLLWRICYQGVQGCGHSQPHFAGGHRHRDLLLAATGEDSDRLVNELLIRFCSAYLDQGFANWTLPDRDGGFLKAFDALYGRRLLTPERWLSGLKRELAKLRNSGMSPLESIAESLADLGVVDEERDEFLLATLLSLRGWAGMLWQMETNAEWTVHPAPQNSLLEFLAVRLILDRLALAFVARRELGFRGPLRELRQAARSRIAEERHAGSDDQRAFLVFQLAQVLDWRPADLYRLSHEQWADLVEEIEDFWGMERRRLFHRAYERHYRHQTLDAFAAHSRRPRGRNTRPSFQLVTCIDDREESFRRHLEEVAPDCETYGAAGFYAVAMYYRGAADAHYLPLCPVMIKPEHFVREDVFYTFEESHRRRAETRRAIGTASHQWHLGSRTFLGGILTALLGSLASIPMVTRILFPRLTARLRKRFGRWLSPPPATQLLLERSESKPGPTDGHIGYNVAEMAVIVERILRDIGLTSNFSRLIIFAGHGSSSLNNPHESAYNCGACSGGRGGPNARAFAQMANDARVRDILDERGIRLPREVVFVGCYHNTCDDSIVYYDLDRLPATHRVDFEAARKAVDIARARNAHERCRRFESARLTLTPEEALRHVEGRSEDLSQARPEYNHATNSLCIVARRERCRGLFLDRRAFLTSYDPTQDDDEQNILLRILQAAVPVCAGISLEYYFSCVDPAGWGCGSKLPHNITSLLGVMEGAASDLRPGLSQQMIEIHEPVRIMFIIETTPEAMLSIMERNDVIRRLIANGWVQLAVLDPDSPRIQEYRNGRFEPYEPESTDLPVVDSSLAWYRGWRDHLGYAAIHDPAAAPPPAQPAAVSEQETRA